jgi:hypothetical protein
MDDGEHCDSCGTTDEGDWLIVTLLHDHARRIRIIPEERPTIRDDPAVHRGEGPWTFCCSYCLADWARGVMRPRRYLGAGSDDPGLRSERAGPGH